MSIDPDHPYDLDWHTIAAFEVRGRQFEIAKLRDRRRPTLILFDENGAAAHALAYFKNAATAQEFIDLFRILTPYTLPGAPKTPTSRHFASEDPPHKPGGARW